jgi:hypothetical protein
MVSVDAMHMRATQKWPGGFFASYHAYPYYPDFLRLQPEYRSAEDPYAKYLADLRKHHRNQAVMITEFGVPTGIGVAHRGPLGRRRRPRRRGPDPLGRCWASPTRRATWPGYQAAGRR